MKNKCKDCLKKLKCQICGKFYTIKWLTSHTEREHQSTDSKPKLLEKPSNNKRNTMI